MFKFIDGEGNEYTGKILFTYMDFTEDKAKCVAIVKTETDTIHIPVSCLVDAVN